MTHTILRCKNCGADLHSRMGPYVRDTYLSSEILTRCPNCETLVNNDSKDKIKDYSALYPLIRCIGFIGIIILIFILIQFLSSLIVYL